MRLTRPALATRAVPTRALAAPALALALALTGCAQPEEANDNGPQDQPTTPGEVRRTPQPDPSASLTVDAPGPTRSP